jgi:sugar phosphate isomerase/epimerase
MKNNLRILRIPLIVFLLMIVSCAGEHPGKKAARELGWEVGFQAYTFHKFTFTEALLKGDSIGLTIVEAYPGQEIGGGIEGTTEFTMDQETRNKLKELLAARGMQMKAYGVAVPEDSAGWKQLFDFAKDMGIGVITSEPGYEVLDYVGMLADEYNIKVAFHNHPAPSMYWNPDTVLKALEGKSMNLGVCADIGHWIRSGLDPLECLKKLEGRIVNLHFKDLNEKSAEAHDIIWGTGVADIPAVLAELKRQGFKGLFNIEYEHNWYNNVPEIKESVDNFYDMVAELE